MSDTTSSYANCLHLGEITAAASTLTPPDYSYYSSHLAQAHTEPGVAAADQKQSSQSELEPLKTASSDGIMRLADSHHPFGMHCNAYAIGF